MKKFSRIRLLFPLFALLLWASRPGYGAISSAEATAATCTRTVVTVANWTNLSGTSTAPDDVCLCKKKLYPEVVTPMLVGLAVYHTTLTSTPTWPGNDSESPAVPFAATRAIIFSNSIDLMGAGRR